VINLLYLVVYQYVVNFILAMVLRYCEVLWCEKYG